MTDVIDSGRKYGTYDSQGNFFVFENKDLLEQITAGKERDFFILELKRNVSGNFIKKATDDDQRNPKIHEEDKKRKQVIHYIGYLEEKINDQTVIEKIYSH